jgi:hypothetical protein
MADTNSEWIPISFGWVAFEKQEQAFALRLSEA